MGKASTGKKVARVAGTGGGRTTRGSRPWGYASIITAVVVLGSLLLVTSRGDRLERISAGGDSPPRTTDHWHAAYGFHVCGSFLPSITDERDPQGIHTHAQGGVGDGVIHIHPFTSAAAGKNATLGKFAEAAGLTLSPGVLKVPGSSKTYRDGDKCGDKPSILRVSRDGKVVPGNPRRVRFLRDRHQITIFFGPFDEAIPDAPTIQNLDKLTDVDGSGPSSTVLPLSPPSTTESTGTTTPATTAKPK